jgi:bacterioferritin-associated ferredoxin
LIVCLCQSVTDRDIRRAVRAGANTLRLVAEATGAGICCGGCRSSIRAIVAELEAKPETQAGAPSFAAPEPA